jgi:hypothetical protein
VRIKLATATQILSAFSIQQEATIAPTDKAKQLMSQGVTKGVTLNFFDLFGNTCDFGGRLH